MSLETISKGKCELSPPPWRETTSSLRAGLPALGSWVLRAAFGHSIYGYCPLVLPASPLASTCTVFPFSFFLISSYPATNIVTWLSKPLAFKNTDKVIQYCNFCCAVKNPAMFAHEVYFWDMIDKGRGLRTCTSRPWVPCDPFTHMFVSHGCPMAVPYGPHAELQDSHLLGTTHHFLSS